MEERLKDPGFRNWTKAALLLDFAMEPLKDRIEPLINKQHATIKDTVKKSQPGLQQTCESCSFDTAPICPSKTCSVFRQEIETVHRFGGRFLKHTKLEECWNTPWDFAKCFMQPGYRGMNTASKTDFAGFMNIVINNLEMQTYTAEDLGNPNNIFVQAKDVRHSIMHTSSFTIADGTLQTYTEVITKLLTKLGTQTASRAISRIKMLDDNNISPADASHVISQAVTSLSKLMVELKQTIPDMNEMCTQLQAETDKGVKTIADVVSKGIADIEHTAQHGIKALHDKTDISKKEIEQHTSNLKADFEKDADRRKQEETERSKIEMERNREQIQRYADERKESLESEIAEKIEKINTEGTASLTKTKQMTEEVLKKADQLEETTKSGVHKITTITQLCMEKLCQDTATFGESLQDFQTKTGENFQKQMDSSVKACQALVESIKETYNEERRDMKIRIGKLEEETSNLKKNINSEESKRENESQKRQSGSANALEFLNIRHTSDEKDCSIFGMVKLDREKLALVDKDNDSVKIIDVGQNKITSNLQLDGNCPQGIACISTDQLVVTGKDKLVILKLNEHLEIEREIETDSYPNGIGYDDETFIVSFLTTEPSVKILNMDGNVLKSFTKDSNGEALFKCPQFIALSPDKQTILVSDWKMNRVISLTLDGTLRYIYDHSALKVPLGVTVGQNGDVYIANNGLDNIHRMSAQCKHVDILMENRITARKPKSLAYCEDEHKLYISSGESGVKDKIFVYQII